MQSHAIPLLASLFAGSFLVGCSGDADDPAGAEDVADSEVTEALTAGVNGDKCVHSAYNCALRAVGGNRVELADGTLPWAVSAATVRDGLGDPMIKDTNGGHIEVNYGQIRHFAGETLVMAMTTQNASAGWYPIASVKDEAGLRARVGNVDAHDPGKSKMGCYEVMDAADAALVPKKVVRDAQGDHERAGDYMSLVRANGKRYANLAYSVPGDALGAPAVDIFPAGTKFQRVDVPTSSGRPHLTVRLYAKATDGHYTKPDGTMTFVYGYVVGAGGVKRFGWMAAAALKAAGGC